MTWLDTPDALDDALTAGGIPGTPPDHARRVFLAANAVIGCAGRCGMLREPLEDAVIDLVADLIHLCDATGLDWAKVVDLADIHHSDEVGQ